MRQWWWLGLWAVTTVSLILGSAPAWAVCFNCGADLSCIAGIDGGKFCFQGPGACSLVMPCVSGGPRRDPIGESARAAIGGDDVPITAITVLEDSPSATFGGMGRVARGAGRGALGRSAARLVRASTGAPVFESGVVTAMLGFGDGAALAFRSRTGDGFALERRSEPGGGVRLTVRELFGHGAGRLLASERVEPDDVLLVRIVYEGRPRMLALQAHALSSAEAPARLMALREELRQVTPPGVARGELPFEISPLSP